MQVAVDFEEEMRQVQQERLETIRLVEEAAFANVAADMQQLQKQVFDKLRESTKHVLSELHERLIALCK